MSVVYLYRFDLVNTTYTVYTVKGFVSYLRQLIEVLVFSAVTYILPQFLSCFLSVYCYVIHNNKKHNSGMSSMCI